MVEALEERFLGETAHLDSSSARFGESAGELSELHCSVWPASSRRRTRFPHYS